MGIQELNKLVGFKKKKIPSVTLYKIISLNYQFLIKCLIKAISRLLYSYQKQNSNFITQSESHKSLYNFLSQLYSEQQTVLIKTNHLKEGYKPIFIVAYSLYNTTQ